MKIKEVYAQKKETNQQIIYRYLENGTRYIKHIPFHPQVYTQLKKQFEDKPVEVTLTKSKWIKIEKTGDDKELSEAAKEAYKNGNVDMDQMIDAETNMLKKAGFTLTIKDEEVDI